MAQAALSPLEDPRQKSAILLEEVQRTQRAWIEAPDEEREFARTRFMMAHAFKTLVFYDEEPDGRLPSAFASRLR